MIRWYLILPSFSSSGATWCMTEVEQTTQNDDEDRIPRRWSWEGISVSSQVRENERKLLVKNSDDPNLSFLSVAISMDVHQRTTTHSNVNESWSSLDLSIFSPQVAFSSLVSSSSTLCAMSTLACDPRDRHHQKREKCFVVLKALMTHNSKPQRRKNLLVSYMLIFDNYDFTAGELLSLALVCQ